VVLMAGDGRLAVAGRRVSEAELLGLVGGAEADGPTAVSLKADAALEAVQVVMLLEKLRAAGVRSITLMTARES